jgi:hypothetical protein
LLKGHCSGGPSAPSSSNSNYWTCNGLPAKFRYTWTASNATRTTQEAIVKAQLKSIGVEIVDAALPANVVFGPTGIPSVRLHADLTLLSRLSLALAKTRAVSLAP